MNRFKKLRVMKLFPIQLGWKLHWFRMLHFAITSIYTVFWLLLLLGLVPYCFVTSGVDFLLKRTHSYSNTIHWLSPSLCMVYQLFEVSVFTWIIILLNGHIILKGQHAVYLLTDMIVSLSRFNSMVVSQFYIVWVNLRSQDWVKCI